MYVSGSSEVNNKRGLMSLDTPESSEGGSIDNNEYAAGDNEGGRRPGSKRYSFPNNYVVLQLGWFQDIITHYTGICFHVSLAISQQRIFMKHIIILVSIS